MLYTSRTDGHITHLSTFMADNAIANFIIIHGMAEHRFRYDGFAKTLQDHNFNVYTLDLRGHGESPYKNKMGNFGKFNGHKKNTEDIAGIIKEIKEFNNLPIILFGHSMGSLFARAVVKNNPRLVDQLILSGSPYKPVGMGPMRYGLKFVSLFFGSRPAPFISKVMNDMFIADIKNPKTDLDWLSFDEENVKNYISDPLCNFPFTFNGYKDLMNLLKEVYDFPFMGVNSKLPILMLIGLHDPCADFKRDGFNRAINRLKEAQFENIFSIVYEESRHELLNDVEKEDVVKDIILYIQDNL